jgi:uncharacterized protein DUF4333
MFKTLLGAGLLCVLVPGCQAKIDNDKLNELITSMFKEQLKLEVSDIECPKNIKVVEGDKFECEVTVKPSGKVPVVVKMKDKKGSVEAETKYAVLTPQMLTDEITKGLQKQNLQAAIDCGKEVRLKKPGSHYTCSATPPGAPASRIVNVDVSDDGNVAWKVE